MKNVGTFNFESLKPGSVISDWITFPERGNVHLTSGKVDIGQGISTALAQIAAEELQVDLARVRVIGPSTRYSPNEGVTSGSFSVQQSGEAIRRACATAREAAIATCAAMWNLQNEFISVQDGWLISASGSQKLSYWDLDLSRIMSLPIDANAPTADPGRYSLVGTNAGRIDLASKVFGKSSFIQDLSFPDMLHGRIIRFPNRFANIDRLNVTNQTLEQRFPGATFVRDGNFLAVIAPREEQAVAAAEFVASATDWDVPDRLPDEAGLKEFLRSAPNQASTAIQRGAIHEDRPFQFEAHYSRSILAHASIGPSCAIARWTEEGLEVWTHSQGIFNLRDAIATFLTRAHPERAGLRLEVHHAEGSGCYGHNPADDVAFDAVLLARATEGRPVRVIWSRADELSCGPFGSAQMVEIGASLDSNGRIASWRQKSWANGYTIRPGRHGSDVLSFIAADRLAIPFQTPIAFDPPMAIGGGSDRNCIPQYEIPVLEVVAHRLLEMPIRMSALRALGGHPNIFAIESFMDELAHLAGRDPVEFRLAHLSEDRARAVIELAIADAPWWQGPKAEGEGRGLGYARYKHTGAWCAVAVRISAEESIRVVDVSSAVDVGLAVNPDGVRNQIQGGIIQSCSWTLKEAIRVNGREVVTRSWEDYPILQFSDAPKISVSVIQRLSEPSIGAGEASIGPTAAAIGNAVYDALGLRLRDLPITPERILEAINA
jgi:nicotinate dehydrogenase subunit B